ncbi:enoyl-CoA hydratase [Tsuneonella deserti]|jgi:enoyl-CoA hydratase/carnithine racemase|uniref:Enoyl-CoA hydratase n=1 Tax=Tsuneonella deserti TaxID=2035528 RepID=A0ABQ1RYE3_9SPHN|nr:enoyl-CoA hydratase/isomerase family protein [Tsuneonella deserti]GGD87126.1 enoyl-CoA hydratase [Tsuneonella deserti]
MPYENILVDQRGAARWITLNRPLSLNSLSLALAEDLHHAFAAAETDEAVRACVITGAGRAFCAGADLVAVSNGVGDGALAGNLNEFLSRLGETLNRIEASRLPVIAAVNGLAVAGGLELVLCCDLVVAVRTANFGDAHANYGLLPGGGGSVRLPRKIGVPRAAYLMLTGKTVSSADMKDAGLVAELTEPDELEPRAQALAEMLAEKSRPGLAYIKEMIRAGQDMSAEEGLRSELETMNAYASSTDLFEGLSAFREKRKPRFLDR